VPLELVEASPSSETPPSAEQPLEQAATETSPAEDVSIPFSEPTPPSGQPVEPPAEALAAPPTVHGAPPVVRDEAQAENRSVARLVMRHPLQAASRVLGRSPQAKSEGDRPLQVAKATSPTAARPAPASPALVQRAAVATALSRPAATAPPPRPAAASAARLTTAGEATTTALRAPAVPPARTSTAAAVARIPTRPALRLVTPTTPAAPAAPTLARAAATAAAPAHAALLGRRTAPTSAARLAEATGARVSYDDATGVETVSFPQPAGAAFAPAVALMRAGEDSTDGGTGSPGAEPTPSAAPAAAPAAPQPAPAPQAPAGGGGGGGDIDEIYDQVMQRLRRDLLADRERMGDLLGDLP
jgi:hypothetical protein